MIYKGNFAFQEVTICATSGAEEYVYKKRKRNLIEVLHSAALFGKGIKQVWNYTKTQKLKIRRY